MEWLTTLDATDYTIAREVLQRGVAGLFFVAFLSAWNQFPALLGEHGLLPARRFVEWTTPRQAPTLFRWRRTPYSDRLLRVICAVGMVLAASVVVGLPQAGPAWVPILVFLAMWGLYFSIDAIGQRFYGFGWESLLLETGFVVGFLGSHEVAPPLLIVIFLWWLVVRVEFGAGMIKMRGDTSWRNLTAMDYHHQTQPMPNPLSRAAHQMPTWWHRAETLGSHVVQLVAPWLLFFPQPIASFAAVAIIVTQLALVVSGNYAWLNWMTILIAFSGISDSFLHWVAGGLWPGWGWAVLSNGSQGETEPSSPVWWLVLVTAVFVWLVVLSVPAVKNLFSHRQKMNASFNRWKLANAYGAFGSMTETRNEIIIQGTLNPDPDEEDWHPYRFKGQPGDVRDRPPQVAPYHLRLDWMMWFAALGAYREEWFASLLQHIAGGDPAIRKLMGPDPFDGEAPEMIRVRMFTYRYATRAERRADREQHGRSVKPLWWVRQDPRTLLEPTTWSGR